jgi:hypothetical protein
VFGISLHQLAVSGLVITAVGFTVTISVKGAPGIPLTEGMIMYETLIGSDVVLLRISVIVAVLPDPAGLSIPVTTARVQAKVAMELELVIVYVFEILLHQLSVAGLVIPVVGLTVTVRVNGVPAHPLTEGVMM